MSRVYTPQRTPEEFLHWVEHENCHACGGETINIRKTTPDAERWTFTCMECKSRWYSFDKRFKSVKYE